MHDIVKRLEAELRAIEVWDVFYYRNRPIESDELAYRLRRVRRRSLVREIRSLRASSGAPGYECELRRRPSRDADLSRRAAWPTQCARIVFKVGRFN